MITHHIKRFFIPVAPKNNVHVCNCDERFLKFSSFFEHGNRIRVPAIGQVRIAIDSSILSNNQSKENKLDIQTHERLEPFPIKSSASCRREGDQGTLYINQ